MRFDKKHSSLWIQNRRLQVVLAALLLALAWWGAAGNNSPLHVALAQQVSEITSPASGSIVNGVVPILGTATIGNFQRYELYFKPSNATDDAFTYIDQGVEEVFDGQLGAWDTTLIQPDIYTLRLRVVQNDGNYSEYFADNITVDPNYSPVPPPVTDPTPSTSIQLAPTATVPADIGAIAVSRVVTNTTSRTITMLGRGVATSAPDRVRVRLYVAGAPVDPNSGSLRTVSEVDLQQVASTLQATGTPLEEVRVIPFSRRPDGSGVVGEVRFTYRQPANLTTFLSDALNRLSANPSVRVVDVAVQYGVADCAALEVQALRDAILAARTRAEPMASVLNVSLGPVLSVSENVAAVPVTGSCLNLLDDTAFLPLGSDTPSQVEVAVTLAVTFVMDPTNAETTFLPATSLGSPTVPAPQDVTPTPAGSNRTHTLQPGETVQSLATIYGVSVEAILAANDLAPDDAQFVQPGSILIIPMP